MSVAFRIPSANYHLRKPCNMRCGFCFATFQDIDADFLSKGHLGREDSISTVDALAEAGKTSVGGAPSGSEKSPFAGAFHRDLSGGWVDTGSDCHNTRHDVLIYKSTIPLMLGAPCTRVS